MKTIQLANGQRVRLVDREQLRVKGPHKKARTPMLKGEPTPPTSFDYSKNEALIYAILGNDQYGDCYYVAICNGSKTWTGNTATEWLPDVNAVTQRYQQISGGDNGLSDTDAMPEWLGGIVGPNGPHKIIDWMVVPQDPAATWEFLFWFCGGMIWTCSLLDTWLNSTSPGTIWDAGGTPDPSTVMRCSRRGGTRTATRTRGPGRSPHRFR